MEFRANALTLHFRQCRCILIRYSLVLIKLYFILLYFYFFISLFLQCRAVQCSLLCFADLFRCLRVLAGWWKSNRQLNKCAVPLSPITHRRLHCLCNRGRDRGRGGVRSSNYEDRQTARRVERLDVHSSSSSVVFTFSILPTSSSFYSFYYSLFCFWPSSFLSPIYLLHS